MSKGGNETQSVTTSEPWAPLRGPLQQLIRDARGLAQNPPEFFPGATFVGALPEELSAYQDRLSFADEMFGDQSPYAQALGANQQLLQGGPAASLYGALAPGLAQSLQNPIGIGDPSQTVTADPNQAIERMLSGTPDFSGVESSIRAFADPVLDIVNQDILPQLASRGVMMNNTTGTTKEANRIIPRVVRDISNFGAQLTENERLRALGAQERGAGLATQAGLTQAGQGLSADIAQQGALTDLLGVGSNLLGQQYGSMAQGVANLPGLTQLGLTPSSLGLEYGQFQRGLEEASLQDQMARHNFEQQQPFQMLDWLRGTLTGVGQGLGTTTQTQTTESDPLTQALGLATTIGSMIPGPWTPFAAGASMANNMLQPIPMFSLPRRI